MSVLMGVLFSSYPFCFLIIRMGGVRNDHLKYASANLETSTVEPQNTEHLWSGHFVRFSETFGLLKVWESEGQNDEHFLYRSVCIPVQVCAQYRVKLEIIHIS